MGTLAEPACTVRTVSASALLPVYAHQGGWDEILFVLTPLALFAGLLVLARRRVDRMESEDGDGTDDQREEREGIDRP
jgi:hypothetical protein